MRIEPLPTTPRYRDRPVALVEPKGRRLRIETDAGVVDSTDPDDLRALKGHVVYVDHAPTRLRHAYDARLWTCRLWRGTSPAAMVFDKGPAVRSLRGALSESADPYGELVRFLTWARRYGVQPASVGTMGWNLWRATLPRTLAFDSDPEVASPALYGGRQQARAGVYRSGKGMASWDIAAAYPTAMAAAPFAGVLRRVVGMTALDLTDEPGLARATVVVARSLPFAPLPLRIEEPWAKGLTLWSDGVVDGTWAWRELRAAQALGCQVTVHEAWAPTSVVDPFVGWWELVQAGRALGDGAGRLAKVCSNTLWGTFAMDGAVSEWTWSEHLGLENARMVRAEEPRRLPHARIRHLAAETTARVRTRLLMEGLYGDGLRGRVPVHVDTDGIICRGDLLGPGPQGDRPGQWRRKRRMVTVDVRAPQFYRYSCVDCATAKHRRWHYVTAGMTPEDAEEHWRKRAPSGAISFGLGKVIEGSTTTVELSPLALARKVREAKVAEEAAMVRGDFPEMWVEG